MRVATKQLKDDVSAGLIEFGYQDGLTGTKARSKFEVSEVDKKIIMVDSAWLAQQYKQGFAKGDREKTAAIERARQAGFEAGKQGKEADFLGLMNWRELQALNKRSLDRESDGDFDFTRVFDQYKAAYDEGYRRGRSTFDTRTPVSLRISGDNLTVERPYTHRLVAIVEYSNCTSQGVSQEAEWLCDPPSVAAIEFDWGEGDGGALHRDRACGHHGAIPERRSVGEGRISIDVKHRHHARPFRAAPIGSARLCSSRRRPRPGRAGCRLRRCSGAQNRRPSRRSMPTARRLCSRLEAQRSS